MEFTIKRRNLDPVTLDLTFGKYIQYKSGPPQAHVLDQDGNKRGWVKKHKNEYEVVFRTMMTGGVRKTFTHRTRKQALINAVEFHNAEKEGRVCISCDKVFDEPLKLFHGTPACPEHSNKNYILSM